MAATLLLLLGACGEAGPAVLANPQTITFPAVAPPAVGQTVVVVEATASSGLPVSYTSRTPAICSVNGRTGEVTGLNSSTCIIAAHQSGNARFAPAPEATQDIVFRLMQIGPTSGSRYSVVATFYEPDTQPNNSIFVGSFELDATTGVVSNLRGILSESMTGGTSPYPSDTMAWVQLDHQLSSVTATIDGASGLLVTTFRLPTTDTLSSAPALAGIDGFSPGTGSGLHFGYPGENPGNAYVRIFVNLGDPTAKPTQAQIDKLAYADCTPGGMMGATCMTGTAVAGYGSVGTMSGYPLSQITMSQP
jgi:hypothetical protein